MNLVKSKINSALLYSCLILFNKQGTNCETTQIILTNSFQLLFGNDNQ